MKKPVLTTLDMRGDSGISFKNASFRSRLRTILSLFFGV